MWRAYGGNSGVALVFKNDALFRTDDVGVYASAVAYWSQEQVEQELTRIASRVEANAEAVSAAGPDFVQQVLFNMFRFAVLCTKHPGFAEELEWRIITSPLLEQSPILRQTVEVIRGTPQLVQRIGLKDVPEHGITGLSLPGMLDRIIIGPCEYSLATYDAFRHLLTAAGIESPSTRIHVSDIPLRVAST